MYYYNLSKRTQLYAGASYANGHDLLDGVDRFNQVFASGGLTYRFLIVSLLRTASHTLHLQETCPIESYMLRYFACFKNSTIKSHTRPVEEMLRRSFGV